MVHAFQLLFIDCNYPRAFVWWIGMHAVMFFFLFNEFYKSTYKAKQDKVSYDNVFVFFFSTFNYQEMAPLCRLKKLFHLFLE